MSSEEKNVQFGEELVMVWVLDDEDNPNMRRSALSETVVFDRWMLPGTSPSNMRYLS